MYQPSRASSLDPNPAFEINDEDVLKAFQAKPQLGQEIRVATFSFDKTKHKELLGLVAALTGVRGTYQVPGIMVTGRRRFKEETPWEAPKDISIKKLRLLSAQAHCDLLMLFDYGYRIDKQVNGLSVLDVLLLPIFFMPYIDVVVDSYVEVYVMDVRNGYLYGQLMAEEKDKEEYVTIWTKAGERLVETQWSRLMVNTKKLLDKLLSEERQASSQGQAEGPGQSKEP